MTIWTNEIHELDALYKSFKGHLPDIVKEMEQLIRTDDANVVMLYSRRCLEVIITDLCECELKRPRKTEPLKGIIDKLNSEEKVPSHIIASMQSLNSMATFGAHPKDFDPEQVKPVLNNLAIIIKWYLKYKDFQVVSKTEAKEEVPKSDFQNYQESYQKKVTAKPKKGRLHWSIKVILGLVLFFGAFLLFNLVLFNKINRELTDENQLYEVKIGEQVWMAQNLRTTKFNDGTPIPLVTDKKEWAKMETPGYCWYNNNSRKFEKSSFGALYNWYAVNTGRLCPAGWHVPTDAEWSELFENVGGEDIAGDELKEVGRAYWQQQYNRATNHSGFSAVGGGSRNMYGPFGDLRKEGMWWSSTVNNEMTSMSISIFAGAVNVLRPSMDNKFGLSVRCINDLPLLTDYDKNFYKTVKIGNQIWMAENLKTTRLNDGTPITMETRNAEVKNSNTPAYCWYENDEATYRDTYGALYNWYAVSTGKLCPVGWHVPSNDEWTTLAEYLGGEDIAGGKMKEKGTSHWTSPNSDATNESGFTALPGGFGGYNNFSFGGYFWSSTEYTELSWAAYVLFVYAESTRLIRDLMSKSDGYSVRCVKDK